MRGVWWANPKPKGFSVKTFFWNIEDYIILFKLENKSEGRDRWMQWHSLWVDWSWRVMFKNNYELINQKDSKSRNFVECEITNVVSDRSQSWYSAGAHKAWWVENSSFLQSYH